MRFAFAFGAISLNQNISILFECISDRNNKIPLILSQMHNLDGDDDDDDDDDDDKLLLWYG